MDWRWRNPKSYQEDVKFQGVKWLRDDWMGRKGEKKVKMEVKEEKIMEKAEGQNGIVSGKRVRTIEYVAAQGCSAALKSQTKRRRRDQTLNLILLPHSPPTLTPTLKNNSFPPLSLQHLRPVFRPTLDRILPRHESRRHHAPLCTGQAPSRAHRRRHFPGHPWRLSQVPQRERFLLFFFFFLFFFPSAIPSFPPASLKPRHCNYCKDGWWG